MSAGGPAPANFDVIIVGGGLTGVAIAHATSQQGLRTALIEGQGLGAERCSFGVSLTRLGGTKLPRQRRARAKKEAVAMQTLLGTLLEQQTLVCPQSSTSPTPLRQALSMLWSGSVATGNAARELKQVEPNLATQQALLSSVGVFSPQRLLALLAKAAQQQGAVIYLGQETTGLLRHGSQVVGVKLLNKRSGQTEGLTASVVINSSGRGLKKVAGWAEQQLALQGHRLLYLKFSQRLTQAVVDLGQGSYLVPKQLDSMLGPISLPSALADDDDQALRAFISQRLQRYAQLLPILSKTWPQQFFVRHELRLIDPQGASPPGLREARIFDHARSGAPGLISVLGGADLEHRWMAEQIAALTLGRCQPERPTKRLEISPLPGLEARTDIPRWVEQYALSLDKIQHITRRHGGQAHKILQDNEESESGARMVFSPTGLSAAEVQILISDEHSEVLDDVIRCSDATQGGTELGLAIVRLAWQWRATRNTSASAMLSALNASLQKNYQQRRPLIHQDSAAHLYTELLTTGLSGGLSENRVAAIDPAQGGRG